MTDCQRRSLSPPNTGISLWAEWNRKRLKTCNKSKQLQSSSLKDNFSTLTSVLSQQTSIWHPEQMKWVTIKGNNVRGLYVNSILNKLVLVLDERQNNEGKINEWNQHPFFLTAERDRTHVLQYETEKRRKSKYGQIETEGQRQRPARAVCVSGTCEWFRGVVLPWLWFWSTATYRALVANAVRTEQSCSKNTKKVKKKGGRGK